MNRKPVEIERQMVAKNATEKDIEQARTELNEAARRRFPQYTYVSWTKEARGKLLHVRSTYRYSRWNAFKYWVRCLFSGRQEESCQG